MDIAEFFYYFLDFREICRVIAKESTRYAMQKGREFVCCSREIEVFFGIMYFMGVVRLPAYRDYWRTDDIGQEFVKKTMSRNRFFEILQNLHFNNNMDEQVIHYRTRL